MAAWDEQIPGQQQGTTPTNVGGMPPASPFQSAPLANPQQPPQQGGGLNIPTNPFAGANGGPPDTSPPDMKSQLNELQGLQPQIQQMVGNNVSPIQVPQAPQISGPIPPPERFGTGIGGAILGTLYGAARGLTMTPQNEKLQAEVDKANQLAIERQNQDQFDANKEQWESQVKDKDNALKVTIDLLNEQKSYEQANRLEKNRAYNDFQNNMYKEQIEDQRETLRRQEDQQHSDQFGMKLTQEQNIANSKLEAQKAKDSRQLLQQQFNNDIKSKEFDMKVQKQQGEEAAKNMGLDPKVPNYLANGQIVPTPYLTSQMMSGQVPQDSMPMPIKDVKSFQNTIRQVNTMQMDTNRMVQSDASVFNDPNMRGALQYLSQQVKGGGIGAQAGGVGASIAVPDSIKNNMAKYMEEHNLTSDQMAKVNDMMNSINTMHETAGQLMMVQQNDKIGRSGQMMMQLINDMLPGLGTMNERQFRSQMYRYQQNMNQIRQEYQMDVPGSKLSNSKPMINAPIDGNPEQDQWVNAGSMGQAYQQQQPAGKTDTRSIWQKMMSNQSTDNDPQNGGPK